MMEHKPPLEQGIELDAVNESLPEWIDFFGSDCRKVGANEYWDDRAVAIVAGAPTVVCWCNDCEHGRADDEGIMCINRDSEWWAEWRGTYDSCEQCKPRREETP